MEKSPLLEGIGRGKIGRIVMARIPIGVDLLDSIHEVVQRGGPYSAKIPNFSGGPEIFYISG
jgi:hypothetical protein